MKETSQQYVNRISSFTKDKNPLAIQSATANRLESLVRKLPSASARKRPAPGKWSIAEILAHLAETEIVIGYRIRLILSQPGTVIQAFDQDMWAAAGKYAKRRPADSLALFRAVRTANVNLLKSLNASEWKRHGMHAERGRETLRSIATLIAGHDLNHIQQVERILADSRGRK